MNDPIFAIRCIERMFNAHDLDEPAKAAYYAACMTLLTELELHLQNSRLPQKVYTSHRIARLRDWVGIGFGFDFPIGALTPEQMRQQPEELLYQILPGFQLAPE